MSGLIVCIDGKREVERLRRNECRELGHEGTRRRPCCNRAGSTPVTVTQANLLDRCDEDEPVRFTSIDARLLAAQWRSLDRVLRNTVTAHSALAVQ